MGYRALVTAILVVHFAFLVYVVLGGFLAWRFPRAFWPHLVAASWGLLVIIVPIVCPLTWAEDWARQRAGEAGLTQGFIDRYIEGVLYPERYTPLLWTLAGLTVLFSWLVALRRHQRRRRSADRHPRPADLGVVRVIEDQTTRTTPRSAGRGGVGARTGDRAQG